jgi:hypothetical protein
LALAEGLVLDETLFFPKLTNKALKTQAMKIHGLGVNALCELVE